MTLRKGANGIFTGDFRGQGMPRAHLSLRTDKKREAQERHDAIARVWREKRVALAEQVKAGIVTVERVLAMVQAGEPLVPVVTDTPTGPAVQRPSHFGTIDQLVARYLAWLPTAKRAPRTVALNTAQCKRFQAFEYQGKRTGDYHVEDVTRAHVMAYQRSMTDADVPKNTVTTYMSRVQALWTFAAKDEQDAAQEERRAPVALYVPVKAEQVHTETEARERMLSAEEGRKLLAATPDRLLFLVACGLLAGLRLGETLNLRPMLDVDLELGSLTIQKHGDGWKPKTRNSYRTLAMAPELLTIAKGHAERYASSQWMFPSPVVPGECLTDAWVRVQFQPIVERAGMRYGRDHKDGVTFHTLRHSFASHAVTSRVDLYTVAKLLGDSLKQTERTYAKISPDFKLAAMQRVAAVFLPGADFSRNDAQGAQ